LRSLGHPAQLIDGLDEAMAHGQTKARDRETGQASLFDALGTDDSDLERPLPVRTEAPSRERLRWEKELLGLYLSDHPLGELAAEMGRYVDAWSADVGEPLDQQRVVVGGMAVGIRRVITRNRESMAVVTLEDLQGTVDVVVFPRTYAETGDTWREDTVLLVAGRVDHKGDETVVLADTVWTWDAAVLLGPEAFARAVAAGDRGRRGPRRDGNGRSSGQTARTEGRDGAAAALAGVPPAGVPPGPASLETLTIPRGSPLRGSKPEGTLVVTIGLAAPGRSGSTQRNPTAIARTVGSPVAGSPAHRDPPGQVLGSNFLQAEPPEPIAELGGPLEPISGLAEPPAFAALVPDRDEEPPLPDEILATLADAATAPTEALEAGPGQILHVRFASAPNEHIVAAFGELRALIKSRPGTTPVVLHIPAGAGRTQEMRLGVGIAYDAELLADVRRRFGDLLQLRLA
jgi:hypothetical protein